MSLFQPAAMCENALNEPTARTHAMIYTKDWILIAGLVVAFLGWECLPHGQHLNAENNASLFAQSSSRGAFFSFGGITLAAGTLIVIVSFFIPRR